MQSQAHPQDIVVPRPRDLLETMMAAKEYPYSSYYYSAEQVRSFRVRDRALVSLEYVGELKVSDALRIRRKQVSVREDEVGSMRLGSPAGPSSSTVPPFGYP